VQKNVMMQMLIGSLLGLYYQFLLVTTAENDRQENKVWLMHENILSILYFTEISENVHFYHQFLC